jgi:hypothetical protein
MSIVYVLLGALNSYEKRILLSSGLSVRPYAWNQRGYHLTDFRKILYWGNKICVISGFRRRVNEI